MNSTPRREEEEGIGQQSFMKRRQSDRILFTRAVSSFSLRPFIASAPIVSPVILLTRPRRMCGVTRDNRARFPINGRRRGEIHRNDRTTNFPLFRRNGEREGRRIVPIMNDNGKISISKNLEIDTTPDTGRRLRICPVNFAREGEDGKSSIRFQARNREKIRDSTSSRNGI